jgi:signal transduction histidine kinase
VLTVREALQNVVAHAFATEVTVALQVKEAQLKIIVKDNGRGFDLAQTKLGNGLANMRRRIESLGGHFEINSHPGHGSMVQLTLRMNPPSSRTGG